LACPGVPLRSTPGKVPPPSGRGSGLVLCQPSIDELGAMPATAVLSQACSARRCPVRRHGCDGCLSQACRTGSGQAEACLWRPTVRLSAATGMAPDPSIHERRSTSHYPPTTGH